MALRTRSPALAYPWDDAVAERRFALPRPCALVPGGPLGLLACVLVALALGVVAALQPVLALAGVAGALVFAWTMAKPVRGAYLMVLLVPLVVGLGRGRFVPVLRPNEALILFLLGVAILSGTFGKTAGRVRLGPMTGVDRAFALLFIAGSLLPLVVQLFRSDKPTVEDTFQLLSLIKYYVGYRLLLAVVRDDRQMLTATKLMVAASAIVAIVGIMQYGRIFNMQEILAGLYDSGQVQQSLDVRRATSTLGVWQALADYMAVHAALCMGLLAARVPGGRGLPAPHAIRGCWRWALIGALFVAIAGALATATLTAVLALVLALGMMAAFGGYLRRAVLWAIPVTLLAAIVFWPAVQERWDYQFTSWGASGDMPVTWEYRITNLTTIFWPAVENDLLLGVAPSVSPDLAWQFPENQQMYLLYQGGLIYVAAYFIFMWVVLRASWRFLKRLDGPALAVGRAAFIAWTLMLVLGLFDTHLTMAGEADAAWTLLALATGAAARAAGEPA
ncbi:MAG TPA: hypothetical protein VK066_11705 [Chloroflexota bacterium]|nr:hypothetical protein [Chloroflexota bacterium]